MSQPAIFISYRRNDALTEATLLARELKTIFDDDEVFIDIADIPPGDIWDKRLEQIVANSRVVLCVIKNTVLWLNLEEQGHQRIKNDDDWVGIELKIAFEDKNKIIIPVFFDGAEMPKDNALPPFLHNLKNHNIYRINKASIDQIHLLAKKISDQTEIKKKVNAYVKNPKQNPDAVVGMHSSTCDRSEQWSKFVDTRDSEPAGQPLVFYLFGHEKNLPELFVDRVKYFFSKLNNAKTGDKAEVKLIKVSTANAYQYEALQRQIRIEICSKIGVDPAEMRPIIEKKVVHLIKANNSDINSYNSGDFLILFAEINCWILNSDSVRKELNRAIKELNRAIKELLGDEPMINSPKIICFVSIEYEDDDFAEMETEVISFKEELEYDDKVVVLPQLSDVQLQDIKSWLKEIGFDPDTRNKILEGYFPDISIKDENGQPKKNELFMVDVKSRLQKIISKHFNEITT